MRLLFSLILTFFYSIAHAQDFDKMLLKKQIECSDISYNSSLLFIQYYESDKIDSAHQLLHYWEGKCGLREPIFRARILLSLKEGNYRDSLLTKEPLDYLFLFQNRFNNASIYDYDAYKNYYAYIPVDQDFDKFTFKSATELKSKYSSKSEEFLLCEFYSNKSDSILTKIKSKEYKNSIITKQYNEIINNLLKIPEGHLSLAVGIWMPTGGAKILGNHPELGWNIGLKSKKISYDLAFAFRFLKSQNYYNAIKGSNRYPQMTKHFFGAYMGFELGRDIYAKKANEIQLIAGTGIDGFDMFKSAPQNNETGLSTFSYNFNLGTSYRFYINGLSYLGLKLKYNIVDYTLNNRIEFSGNTFSFQIVYGRVNNASRNYNLKRLGYKVRR